MKGNEYDKDSNLCSAVEITLFSEYLNAVEQVKSDKKLTLDEKLFKVAQPLYVWYNLFKPVPDLFNKAFNDEYVDLENELDLSKLKNDSQRYEIDTSSNDYYFGGRQIIRPQNKVFIIDFDVIKNQEITYKRLCDKWIPYLTQTIIKREDLLTKILVVFIIKRALNGNEDAINKLCQLYEKKAISKAINIAKKKGLDEDDIKQQAMISLRYIISGFDPKVIFDSILKSKDLSLPKWYKKFYLEYFTGFLPDKINEALISGDGLLLMSLLNPYSPVKDFTEWRGTPKRISMFNKDSFRPTKAANLTTWIFGPSKKPMQGKFNQLLKAAINTYLKNKKEIRHVLIQEKDDLEISKPVRLQDGFFCPGCKQSVLAYEQPGNCEDHKVGRKTKDSEKKIINENTPLINDEELRKVADELRKHNIFRRNVERSIQIILDKLKGFSYNQIAKKYGMSKRQIINIYNKVLHSFSLS